MSQVFQKLEYLTPRTTNTDTGTVVGFHAVAAIIF